MKFSEKIDSICVLIYPPNGIPGGPQSQFIHFNNEINTIVTKNDFSLNDQNILLRLKFINK